MSSTHAQPLFVIYDRQYGTYLRLYGNLPDRFESRERYTLFDLMQQQSYSGDWRQQGQQQQQPRPSQSVTTPRRSLAPQGSLPKFVTDLILRDAVTEGKLCPITMDPIEATDAYTVTACYHAFNKEALGRWLRDHSTCPECNGRL